MKKLIDAIYEKVIKEQMTVKETIKYVLEINLEIKEKRKLKSNQNESL